MKIELPRKVVLIIKTYRDMVMMHMRWAAVSGIPF